MLKQSSEQIFLDKSLLENLGPTPAVARRLPAGCPAVDERQVWAFHSAAKFGRKKPFAIASGNFLILKLFLSMLNDAE